MDVIIAILFFLILIVCWLTSLVGLPGNWLVVVGTAVYWLVGPSDSRLAIGWQVIAVLFVLAVIGELVELAAGAAGVSRAGGSRRGAIYALGGSMAGGIVGLFVGLPIPVIGPLVAALLFGSVGATIGALVGESQSGRNFRESLPIGHAAFWGRLFGTLGKTMIGLVMLIVVAAALVLP